MVPHPIHLRRRAPEMRQYPVSPLAIRRLRSPLGVCWREQVRGLYEMDGLGGWKGVLWVSFQREGEGGEGGDMDHRDGVGSKRGDVRPA